MKLCTGLLALTFVTTANFGTSSFANANEKYAQLGQELELMESVLNTSLQQSNEGQSIKFRGLSTQYLANQGVVFKVHTTGTSNNSFTRFGFPQPPKAPAPVNFSGKHIVIEEVISGLEAADIAEALEDVEFIFADTSNELREVRNLVRDLSWQNRDLEREKRDLSFELRSADNKRKAEIESRLNAINKDLAEYEAKQAEVSKQSEKLKAEIKIRKEKQQQASKEAKKAFLVSFEQGVASTLCRFGSGLRAVANDEYVSFVLSAFDAPDTNNKQDRIYVFKTSDIKKCVQDKIKADELLAKATHYDF